MDNDSMTSRAFRTPQVSLTMPSDGTLPTVGTPLDDYPSPSWLPRVTIGSSAEDDAIGDDEGAPSGEEHHAEVIPEGRPDDTRTPASSCREFLPGTTVRRPQRLHPNADAYVLIRFLPSIMRTQVVTVSLCAILVLLVYYWWC